MITFIKNKIQKKNKGFTLLFAVLVSTLVISISATVISIALRQTIISGTSRESQYAFYAANTVVECLLYWDLKGPNDPDIGIVFPVGDETRSLFEASEVTCAGGSIVDGTGFTDEFASDGWDSGSNPNSTTIFLEITDTVGLENSEGESMTTGFCAEGTITKTTNETTGVITTRIEAKGYNTCDLNSPRAVERGLIQSYQS